MINEVDYDFIGSYNNQRITEIDAERSVNLFEYLDEKGKKPKSLISTSGILNSGIDFSPTVGGSRASFVFQNNTYQVFGNKVYLINGALAPSLIGTLNTTTGYVGVDANTFQVIFVDGLNGWIWDTVATTFTLIVDVNFPAIPIDVTYLDGFFVVAAAGTNTFVLSQINNGISYTPLQQGAMTSHPGTIVACRTLHRNLFLFSQNYIEVWENAGIGTNLPFRRNNSLLIEVGTPALGSISVGFDKLFFLSQDRDGLGSVMMISGTQAMPISNRALDFALSQYASTAGVGVADARGICIKENGIIFYRLNFTNANHTYVYNLSMSSPEEPRWHEEEVLDGDRHPAQTHVYFNGINYYGDYLNPILYQVDNSFVTNNGEPIRRMRIGKAFVPGGYQRTRVDRWHLDLVQGQVDNIPGNVAPIVFLSISKDGGQTYGNRIRAPMGQIGQRTFRTVWRKLGVTPRGQAFVPKAEFFNQVPFSVLGAAWAYEVMPE